MNDRATTITELLGRADPALPALLDVDGHQLTYGELAAQVQRLGAELRGAGVAPDDCVAIVLPNGPESAIAFLAAASVAAAAPLNPAYRAQELRLYLDDLRPRALITQPDVGSAAIEVLRETSPGIPALMLTGTPGSFSLGVPSPGTDVQPPDPDAVALLLHTSGTTSRPKLVPLRHRNVASSADNIARWLQLSPTDRCLNVMPLFHIHGLIAAVLASLAGGASIVATPGFDAFRFFGWYETYSPSWYTAVPTMHQLILKRARAHRPLLERQPLRFARSSSASLPPSVLTELEGALGSPVIEAYGMTEASHQMTSNPLPLAERRGGSVGVPAGCEIRIVDGSDITLKAGTRGEVVIRGRGVIDGYFNNPEASASAFSNDWFRTGDEGFLSPDGYLTLTGRLKELINRGGEKISPLEIDHVLLQHPKVAQAVAFAVPNEQLGEEVAAAIVAAEGHVPDPAELRAFIAERLAPFKVPRQIVIVDQIPTGATGKLQRIGLAKRLGLE